jgi:hypothetical protein
MLRHSAESLLRRIIRESVHQNFDLSRIVQDFTRIVGLTRIQFRRLQNIMADRDKEALMEFVKGKILDAKMDIESDEEPEIAKITREMSDAMSLIDKDQLYDAFSQHEKFKTPYSPGRQGAPDTIAAAQQMAPIIGASISPRSITSARKTGKNDRLFTQVIRHPQFRSLAVKYGSSPSSSVATAIVNILIGQ